MRTIEIIVGGDLGPTASNYETFQTGELGDLIDPYLLNVLDSSDMRIFNLELRELQKSMNRP